jgi:hypothetical protein
MNKLSIIKIMKNHVEVEEGKSSFLIILGDRPVGGSSVGASVLRRPIVFLLVRCSVCVRCGILILLIKTVRCSIVRCSVPHCILPIITTSNIIILCTIIVPKFANMYIDISLYTQRPSTCFDKPCGHLQGGTLLLLLYFT